MRRTKSLTLSSCVAIRCAFTSYCVRCNPFLYICFFSHLCLFLLLLHCASAVPLFLLLFSHLCLFLLWFHRANVARNRPQPLDLSGQMVVLANLEIFRANGFEFAATRKLHHQPRETGCATVQQRHRVRFARYCVTCFYFVYCEVVCSGLLLIRA